VGDRGELGEGSVVPFLGRWTMKTTIHSAGLAIFGCVIGAFAQSVAAPPNLPAVPVPAKRTPAAQTLGQTQAKEPPQQYDFGRQLRVLQDTTGMDAQKAVPAASVPAA